MRGPSSISRQAPSTTNLVSGHDACYSVAVTLSGAATSQMLLTLHKCRLSAETHDVLINACLCVPRDWAAVLAFEAQTGITEHLKGMCR